MGSAGTIITCLNQQSLNYEHCIHITMYCHCMFRGKITYYTQPPEQHTLPTHISAQVVTTMAAEFDIDALTNDEKDDMKGKF